LRAYLEAAGLSSISEAANPEDPKKGDLHRTHRKAGGPALEVIGELVGRDPAHLSVAEIDALGRAIARNGSLEWVRPLHAMSRPRTGDRGPRNRAARDRWRQRRPDDFWPRFLAPGAIKVRQLRRLHGLAREGEVVLDRAAARDHPA